MKKGPESNGNENCPKKSAFYTSLPILFALVPLGIVFGILSQEHHFPWYLAILMSALTYGGTSQLICLGLLSSGASVLNILLMVLFLNGRHIFYGLSLYRRFPSTFFKRFFFIFGLTDENYVLLTSTENWSNQKDEETFTFSLTSFSYCYWIMGTILGVYLHRYVPNKIIGLNFILTALFIVLFIEQFKKQQKIFPILYSILSFIVSYYLFPKNVLLGAMIVCFIILGIHYLKFQNVYQVASVNTKE